MVGRFFRMLLASFLCLVCADSLIFAQGDCTDRQEVVSMPSGIKFLEHLPCNYNSVPSHPVLVFLHGLGEVGSNINAVKKHGPPKLIDRGEWGDRPFIVISPQLPSGGWWPNGLIDDVIEHVKRNYKVDENRIYLTGLSLGGIGTFHYAANYPDKLAAVVPIAGCSNNDNNCKMKDVPTWAFHGDKDTVIWPSCSKNAINGINACEPAPGKPAVLTLYPNVGHDSWTRTYDLSAGHDIYSWLLSHDKSNGSSNQPPRVDAGPDKLLTLPDTETSLDGAVENFDGEIADIQWSLKDGPNNPRMSGNNTLTLYLSNLTAGEYTFELKVTDDKAATSVDDVKVDVKSNSRAAGKIQLLPSMMHNESGLGDPRTLVDEQGESGDPLNGAGGSPRTYWGTGWDASRHPASAYLDLGKEYRLSAVSLRDVANSGNFRVEYGEPGDWQELFVDGLTAYNRWVTRTIDVNTRYLRLTKLTSAAYVSEIVLYGEKANASPPPPSPISGKISLSTSMVYNESGLGDPNALVDEQRESGDPLNGTGGSPGTYWNTGWDASRHPASAYLDLGKTYRLSAVSLRDVANSGNFRVEYGEPGNWQELFTDGLTAFNRWVTRTVDVNTRYLRLTKLTSVAYVSEIVLYGEEVNTPPPPSTAGKISLSSSMIYNESGLGDPRTLVDEQAESGDPLNGTSGSPSTYWATGWDARRHPASAYLDLGKTYRLSAVVLRDAANSGNFRVEYGAPGNWRELFMDGLKAYNKWVTHAVDVSTRYLRLTKLTSAAYVSEIVLYGELASASNSRESNGTKEVVHNNLPLENAGVDLAVYPNPVTDEVNISFKGDAEHVQFVKITSLMGQEVFYTEQLEAVLEDDVILVNDMGRLENGIYLLQVGLNDHSFVTRKILKK